MEGVPRGLGAARDSTASAIQSQLLGAEFGNQPVNPGRATALLTPGRVILASAGFLAGHS
jgi:hypothetical protein